MAYLLIGIILSVPLLLLLSTLFDSFKASGKSSSNVISLYEYIDYHPVIDELSPRNEAENRLYGAVVALNPYCSHLTNKDFENAGFDTYSEQYWILFYAKQDKQTSIKEVCAAIMKEGVSFSDRRDMVHNMFKLAKIGDGIRDKEWELIMRVMSELKMNDANTSYLQRLYWNCRNKYSLGFYLARIVNELLELSPKSAGKKSLVENFYRYYFPNEVSATGAIGKPIDDVSLKEAIAQINSKIELFNRRAFMHLLYKLAVEDDGIKYDEWLLLSFLLDELNMQKYADYFNRHYGALRTECDRSEVYRRFSSKYYGSASGQKSQSSNGKSKATSAVPSLVEAYRVLELQPSASKEDVQEAYHRLAKLHHPDLPKNAERRAECVRAMAKINVAYATIIENIK